MRRLLTLCLVPHRWDLPHSPLGAGRLIRTMACIVAPPFIALNGAGCVVSPGSGGSGQYPTLRPDSGGAFVLRPNATNPSPNPAQNCPLQPPPLSNATTL